MKSLLGGIAEAFEDRNFRLYSVGAIVSWLSFFVQAVAVSWTAWDLTHSTRWLAIVALMDAAPNIALMPFGGVVADRHDRFRILLISYGCATLQAAALAGLAFAGQLTIGLLAALAFLHGAIHAFSIPAQFGFLPRFVERRRLSSAIGVAAAYTQLGIFVGPALAGWVILHFGTAVAFASNVAGYGVFFASVALLRTPAGYEQPAASGKAFVADFLDGLRAISGHRGVTAILALMLFGDALSAAVRQMAPAFSDKVLGAGVEGLSTLLAGAGVGATLSALWLAQGGAQRASPSNIVWAFLGFLVAIGGADARAQAHRRGACDGRLGVFLRNLPHGNGRPPAKLGSRSLARPRHEHAISAAAPRRRAWSRRDRRGRGGLGLARADALPRRRGACRLGRGVPRPGADRCRLFAARRVRIARATKERNAAVGL